MKTRTTARHWMALMAAAGVWSAASVHAQIYKCVDAGGKVIGYASQCPPGSESQATAIRSAPAASPAPAGRSLAEQEAEFRKRRLEQQDAQAKSEKLAADQQARARACEDARSYLKSLQSGVRIVRTDPNTGERAVLDEAGYARETAAAQSAVSANCK